ncbi:MAG: hypothetical protein EBU90_09895 [Proteobacteria bacterium]|jgi:hypothetical protein|nr:hypothetical protein [Pseudomonadota bacterium]
MKLDKLIETLKSKRGYLKKGPHAISNIFKVSINDASLAMLEAKSQLRNENTSENKITEFDTYLKNNRIDVNDVKSVKFWQTSKGEQRFSVVTGADNNIEEIKKDIEEFAASYSPEVPKIKYKKSDKPRIALEISLPDIHYGKLTDLSIEEAELQFLSTIFNLVDKASGLNIELIILPIGNDGMNSEGLRLTTTAGTPQHDSTGWRETFRGYCKLMTTAINWLKTIAPVQVIIVQGNHDFERMFYAGDFLNGWYRHDNNVLIDNGLSTRKYFKYGVNMLMFTHGDKEKTSDLPLIMATEEPLMFASSKFREAHCGHYHKEMVNEYRGVKVRFIPSICANDDWHKTMGYEALRAGQAYIWGYETGLEGFLQSNVNDRV